MRTTFRSELLAILSAHETAKISLEQLTVLYPIEAVREKCPKQALKYTQKNYGTIKGSDELTYIISFREMPVRKRMWIVYLPEAAFHDTRSALIRISRTMRTHVVPMLGPLKSARQRRRLDNHFKLFYGTRPVGVK